VRGGWRIPDVVGGPAGAAAVLDSALRALVRASNGRPSDIRQAAPTAFASRTRRRPVPPVRRDEDELS
jgi:hypothetical protein